MDGAGFLGSHLCECLLGEAHDVLCVDNSYTGTKDNIRPLLSHPCFELTGSKSRVETRPLPPDDPSRRCPAITFSRHPLDWQPKASLGQGLKRTIEYFENTLVWLAAMFPGKIENWCFVARARKKRYPLGKRSLTGA